MAQTKRPTRAQKVEAAAKAAVEGDKKPITPRRQGISKKSEPKADVPTEVVVKQPAPDNNVTSMVPRAGKPKLTAGYARLFAHRKPVVDKVQAAIATIAKSYAESDRDDRNAQHQRYELADETLDYLIEQFDHNGFSNKGDRLAFAWLMFDLLRPIGHRTDEVCDLIEDTFKEHRQVLSEKGLGLEIARRREKQQQRRQEQQGNAKRKAA